MMHSSQEIKKICDKYYGINIAIRSRKQKYCFARFIYCKLARHYTDDSMANIGKAIKRNHATILYALKEADNVIAYYKTVKRDFNAINQRIQGTRKRTLEDKYRDALCNAMHYRKKYNQLKNIVLNK